MWTAERMTGSHSARQAECMRYRVAAQLGPHVVNHSHLQNSQ